MNDNRGGNSGFLFGLILGGAIVFLLGTDKGRAILKSLTDEGMADLSDILEEVGEDEDGDYEEPAPRVKKTKIVEPEIIEEVPSVSHSAAPKRRFFRRSRA